MGDEILFKFSKKFKIEQIILRQCFFTNNSFHCLDVFTDSVVCILWNNRWIISTSITKFNLVELFSRILFWNSWISRILKLVLHTAIDKNLPIDLKHQNDLLWSFLHQLQISWDVIVMVEHWLEGIPACCVTVCRCKFVLLWYNRSNQE